MVELAHCGAVGERRPCAKAKFRLELFAFLADTIVWVNLQDGLGRTLRWIAESTCTNTHDSLCRGSSSEKFVQIESPVASKSQRHDVAHVSLGPATNCPIDALPECTKELPWNCTQLCMCNNDPTDCVACASARSQAPRRSQNRGF